jgi:putative phage-type endonuclease
VRHSTLQRLADSLIPQQRASKQWSMESVTESRLENRCFLGLTKKQYIQDTALKSRVDMVEQGSDEWLAVRRDRITATDIAVILGISPWKTSVELWNEKHGRGKPFVSNPAIEHGVKQEPFIREWYEELKDELYTPIVIAPEGDWRMASLDGLNGKKTRVLEIKTCNKDVFYKAQSGKVPDYYISQVQWQMSLLPDASEAEIVFQWKNERCSVVVQKDDLYIEKVTAIAKDWYDRYLVGDDEPPLSERDYLDLSGDLNFECIANEARLVYAELKELERQWKAIKERLMDCTDGGNAKGCGITISNTTRKGVVDTDKLAEDHGIDLEKYRKPSTISTRITVNLKFTSGNNES